LSVVQRLGDIVGTYPYGHLHSKGRRISTGLFGSRLDLKLADLTFRTRRKKRQPAVGESPYPIENGIGRVRGNDAAKTKPQRYCARQRGRQTSIPYAVPLAFVGYFFFGPQPAHDVDLLLEASPARLEIGIEGFKFDGVVAHAQSEANAPPGQ